MMVRWWAAFFACGMIVPPSTGGARAAIAAIGVSFLLSWSFGAAGASARARACFLGAAAGGLILWQAAGLGRAFHDALGEGSRAVPGVSSAVSATRAAGGAGSGRPLDRVSLPRARAALVRLLDDGRLPERARALVAALVLDERSGLPPSLREAYSYLGITHFLALSGMHLAVIACALERLLAPVVRGARRRETILLALLGAYCAIACFPPSLVRSYALIAAATACRAAGLSSDLFGALATGSLAVALIDPAVPFDAGFQLSFAAVCGIAFLGMPLVRIADARAPGGLTGTAIRALAYPAIVTCAVQIFTLPLTVALFGRSSCVSPAANVAVSLPFTVLLYAGFLYAFVPLGVLRDALAPPIALVCRFLDAVPALLARGPQPAILGGDGDWGMYGCGVIALSCALARRRSRRWAWAACGVLLVVGSFMPPFSSASSPRSRVIGARERRDGVPRRMQGIDDASGSSRDGSSGELAGKGYRFYPAGGGVLFVGSRFGEGEARALVRALWRGGTHALECCVIVPSHLRRGHGWHYLARRMVVRRCLVSPYLAASGGAFRASCERAGIECVVVSAGSLAAAGTVVLEVIGPRFPPAPGAAVSSRAARLLCRIAGREGAGPAGEGGMDPDVFPLVPEKR